MTTRDVPQSEWATFLDHFSRQHVGQLARVESAGREFGVQANARNLPLLGVTAEVHGGGVPEIQVMVGDSPDAHVVHAISHPAAVRIGESNDGSSATLQIQSQDGVLTVLQVGATRWTEPMLNAEDRTNRG
jgi:hypothetical protein